MALSAHRFRKLILEPVIAEYMRDFQEFHRAFSAIAAVDAYAAHIFTEAIEREVDVAEKLSLTTQDVRDDSTFRQAISNKYRNFMILRDLAKANKHAQLSRHAPLVSGSDQVSAKVKGWGEAKWGEQRWGDQPQIFVSISGGDEHYVETLVRRSVEVLDGIALDLGIKIDEDISQ
jgi:hypothetical protein